MVKLDILSDPICPWCYIGKTQLDRALAQADLQPFDIEWHPFQLNPEMPSDGMDRRDYLERKFGGKEGAVKVYGQIEEHAKSLGLPIDFAAMKRTPNTINAHRLIHWAGLEQLQGPVVDALFDGYFCKGADIGDVATLVQIGVDAGMDRAALERLFETEEDAQAIRDRDAHSREMGIQAVPTFIVANKHAVPGAQPADMWLNVIADIKKQLAEQDNAD